MYVHYSNNVINILRVTETHMLIVIAKNGSEAAGPLLNDRAAELVLVLQHLKEKQIFEHTP